MNKEEIIYNIVTSLLAGALVFAGAFVDGNVTKAGIIAALAASAIVAITKFRDWWCKNESSFSRILNFI